MAQQEKNIHIPAPDNDEYGDFVIEMVRKNVPNVVRGEIPPKLAGLLAVHVPKALESRDYDLSLTAKNEATAKRLALYARAWGRQQDPAVRIVRRPGRKDDNRSVVRLSVMLESDVPDSARPGRKARGAQTES